MYFRQDYVCVCVLVCVCVCDSQRALDLKTELEKNKRVNAGEHVFSGKAFFPQAARGPYDDTTLSSSMP